MTIDAVHTDPTLAAKAPAKHFAQRREAVDMIARLRSRITLCVLYATHVFRPHPEVEETELARARWREKFDAEFSAIRRTIDLLDGTDTTAEFSQDICDWTAQATEKWPEAVETLRAMLALTQELQTALATGGAALDTALETHMRRADQFHDAASEICDGLLAQLDLERHNDMRRARNSGNGIGEILDRLEGIGKHVRLVSLNASVEAARLGEAGKGMGVIAVEFKSLAEEIQRLAANARNSIQEMTATDDEDAPENT